MIEQVREEMATIIRYALDNLVLISDEEEERLLTSADKILSIGNPTIKEILEKYERGELKRTREGGFFGENLLSYLVRKATESQIELDREVRRLDKLKANFKKVKGE